MNKKHIIEMAQDILEVGEGKDKGEFMAALQAAAAGAIYHSYQPHLRWSGVTEFCNKLSPALQAIIDGQERMRKMS